MKCSGEDGGANHGRKTNDLIEDREETLQIEDDTCVCFEDPSLRWNVGYTFLLLFS